MRGVYVLQKPGFVSYTYGMTQTPAPIIVNAVDGLPVVAGPSGLINAALRGAQALTITGKNATGDTVYLAPRTQEVWGANLDAVTVQTTDIARTVQHPQHGEIVYAWIDTNRLDSAPQLAELDRARRARVLAEAAAAEDRGLAMVPACDNCGDCELCV